MSMDKRWMSIHGSFSIKGGGMLLEFGGNQEELNEEEMISAINAVAGLKQLGKSEGFVLVNSGSIEGAADETLDRHVVLTGQAYARVKALLALAATENNNQTPVEEFLLDMIDRYACRGKLSRELFEGCYEDEYLAAQRKVDRVLAMVKQREPDRFHDAPSGAQSLDSEEPVDELSRMNSALEDLSRSEATVNAQEVEA